MAYKVARTRLFGCWMLNVGLLYPHITLCLFTAAEWVFLVFLFHFFSPPLFWRMALFCFWRFYNMASITMSQQTKNCKWTHELCAALELNNRRAWPL